MSACGCKWYGNQHGSWFRFCEEHDRMWRVASSAVGEDPETLFNRVVVEHAEKVLGR